MQKDLPNSNDNLISIIIPMFNEAANVAAIYRGVCTVFLNELAGYQYEIIYVDDGSTDGTVEAAEDIKNSDPAVKLICLSRNFGKEIATTAGLHASKGSAALMIDADLQHPPDLIPQFVAAWEKGYDVVVGIQKPSASYATFTKRLTANLFYRFMNAVSHTEVVPHATDYRLLDRAVINEFNRFTERNRMTRGLIDWLGFTRTYIEFTPAARINGNAAYSYRNLLRLATDSIVSLSFFPLRIAGYLGTLIVLLSLPLGIVVLINTLLMHNSFKFTGTADLAILIIFLIGIVLICLGLIALYIANIYGEVINRPLYVVKRRSTRKFGNSA